MYAGGLLATLLILGLIVAVISLAMIISEPRVEAPNTRENPADMTRRLRTQGARGRKRVGSGGEGVTS